MRISQFLGLQRDLNSTQNRIEKLKAQISKDSRIVSPRDDVASSSISEDFKSNIGSLMQVNQKNIPAGKSILTAAKQSTDIVYQKLKELRQIAEESQNLDDGDPATAEKRIALQKDFESARDDLDDFAKTSEFAGVKLIDGSLNVRIQTGFKANDTFNISLNSLRIDKSPVAQVSVSSQADAEKAIAYIDEEFQKLDAQYSAINRQQSSLDIRSKANDSLIKNYEESRNALVKLDKPAAYAALFAAEEQGYAQAEQLEQALNFQAKLFSLLLGNNKN